jgi:curved DNA-binding protein CbpA
MKNMNNQSWSDKYKRLEEANITGQDIEDAKKILGINNENGADLKNIYRKLALANHPDVGGDMEKMKKINWAKEVLDQVDLTGKSKSSSSFDWKAYREKSRAFSDKFANDLEKFFKENGDAYIKYFQGFVPEVSEYSFDYKLAELADSAPVMVKFFNPEKTSVFTIRFSASLNQQQGLGTGTDDYSVSVLTQMLHDNKTYKVHQSQWQGTSKTLQSIVNPAEIFPEKALSRVKRQELLLKCSAEILKLY